MTRRFRTLLLATAAILTAGIATVAANPLDPNVAAGSAIVSGEGTANLTVNQATDKAIINWRSFDIGNGETTRFNQPGANSVTLNRVTGGLGASAIDGALRANGKVFLVNPDGILFGQSAIVDTAAFAATSSDIADDDFMAGRYVFGTPGTLDASIVNEGTITAAEAGFAALVAPGVRNAGTITARLGSVGLASANRFTLDFYGDQLLTLAVDDAIAATVRDIRTGQPLDALVGNEGVLRADGGTVELSAAAARTVVDSVVNNSGVIEANSVGIRNGKIVLSAATAATRPAGTPDQKVKVSGQLAAAGKRAGETGGKVQITGEAIELAGASIDASGSAGGGTVLVGGDVGGGHPNANVVPLPRAKPERAPVPTATSVIVDAASVIDASATANGDGGKVIVWADGDTAAHGKIAARGGVAGGDGGFAEISGALALDYAGLDANVAAPLGTSGTVLFDPFTAAPVTVANVGTITNILNQGNGATAIVYGGSVSIETNILKTAGSSATLKIFGDDGITIASGIVIGSTFGRLNILLDADADFNFNINGFHLREADLQYPGSAISEIDQYASGYYGNYLLAQFETYLASANASARAALMTSRRGQVLLPFVRQYTNQGVAEADQSVLSLPANARFFTNGGTFTAFENTYIIAQDVRALTSFPVSQAAQLEARVATAAANLGAIYDGGAIFGGCTTATCYIFTSGVNLTRVRSMRANGQRAIGPAPIPAASTKDKPSATDRAVTRSGSATSYEPPAWLVQEIRDAYGSSREALRQIASIAENSPYSLLAAAAYCQGKHAPPEWEAIGGQESITGMSATIFRNVKTQEVVLAFRGSVGFLDFATYAGLYAGQNLLDLPEMQSALAYAKEVKKAFGEISFTGHSLGGAMAHYAAAELGDRAIAFDPVPISKSLLAAKLRDGSVSRTKVELPAYSNIRNFRGPNDAASALGGYIGEPAIVVKNAAHLTPEQIVLLTGDGGWKFNHIIDYLAVAMGGVRLAAPKILSEAASINNTF